jgi:hypothetical protein
MLIGGGSSGGGVSSLEESKTKILDNLSGQK